MRILLTGAEGFTGRHFGLHATARGHTILPLKSDLTNRRALFAEVEAVEVDAVIHLAGISFVGHADESAIYGVNVAGTVNLLSALAHKKESLKKVLLASSANIYGNCKVSPIRETQEPAPVNHYAMSKLAMEIMARNFNDVLPLVIARPFNYTGVGHDINFIIPKLVDHVSRRASRVSLGNLNIEREFNDVRMVCESYIRLLEVGVTGEIYNLCTGRTYTLQHVINMLDTVTGHKIDVEVDEAFVRPNEVHRLCGDPTKLLQCIGDIDPITLEQTIRWMLSKNQCG